jgi:integrase
MRCGELAGLQWSDVDFNGKHLLVKRQVVWGRVQTTKGNNTSRIDLSTALLNALKTLKRKRQEEWLRKGENEIPKWVFCKRDGNPVDMPHFKARHFHRCLE